MGSLDGVYNMGMGPILCIYYCKYYQIEVYMVVSLDKIVFEGMLVDGDSDRNSFGSVFPHCKTKDEV